MLSFCFFISSIIFLYLYLQMAMVMAGMPMRVPYSKYGLSNNLVSAMTAAMTMQKTKYISSVAGCKLFILSVLFNLITVIIELASVLCHDVVVIVTIPTLFAVVATAQLLPSALRKDSRQNLLIIPPRFLVEQLSATVALDVMKFSFY